MSETEGHDKRINSVLARVAAKRGYTQEAVTAQTPLDDLLAKEEPPDVQSERREALKELMRFFFADGPHPGSVLRRVVAIAKAIAPDFIRHMTLADLGMMLGETRAAQQWRIDKIFSDYQRERGVKGFKAAFQKSEAARSKCARAQRGNRNRSAGGRRAGLRKLKRAA